jgi:hypothetical protein
LEYLKRQLKVDLIVAAAENGARTISSSLV